MYTFFYYCPDFDTDSYISAITSTFVKKKMFLNLSSLTNTEHYYFSYLLFHHLHHFLLLLLLLLPRLSDLGFGVIHTFPSTSWSCYVFGCPLELIC
jgi:hypothetical protein